MKKWLNGVMPDPKTIRESRHLAIFGKRLHDPSLWHMNRRSVSGAFAVGLFVAFMPPSSHMLLAAAAAIVLRVNLPLSVALVWISNPLTIPPMFYVSYVVGSWIMGDTPHGFDMAYWGDPGHWVEVLQPLAIGMFVCGAAAAAAGYVGIRALWRWNVMRHVRRRKERYRTPAAVASVAAVSTPSSSRQT